MEKRDLEDIINLALKPLGFTKKGNRWVSNGLEIIKSVDLQKSRWSNSFHLNWGYIIKALPLEEMKTHIFERLHSDNLEENLEIDNLLCLENDIDDQSRAVKLKKYISEKIISQFKEVNTEADLLRVLQQTENLYTVPSAVIRYFKLNS